MRVVTNAKTVGTALGTAAGAATATKYAGALATIAFYYLFLDPATPEAVTQAIYDILFGLSFVLVTVAIGAISRWLSPGTLPLPALPAAKPEEKDHARTVPGA